MKLIPLDVIEEAKNGDSNAVIQVVEAFRKYIDRRCIYTFRDQNWVTHRELDEDLQQAAVVGLLSAIEGFKYQGIALSPDDTEYIKTNQLHFVRYCTVSIDNAIKYVHRKRRRSADFECHYDDINESDMPYMCTEIENADQMLFAPHEFVVLGRKVYIHNSDLATALRFQPYYLRNPFLAKYYFHYTDKELANLFSMSERTVRRWREKIQERIKDYLSGLEHS